MLGLDYAVDLTHPNDSEGLAFREAQQQSSKGRCLGRSQQRWTNCWQWTTIIVLLLFGLWTLSGIQILKNAEGKAKGVILGPQRFGGLTFIWASPSHQKRRGDLLKPTPVFPPRWTAKGMRIFSDETRSSVADSDFPQDYSQDALKEVLKEEDSRFRTYYADDLPKPSQEAQGNESQSTAAGEALLGDAETSNLGLQEAEPFTSTENASGRLDAVADAEIQRQAAEEESSLLQGYILSLNDNQQHDDEELDVMSGLRRDVDVDDQKGNTQEPSPKANQDTEIGGTSLQLNSSDQSPDELTVSDQGSSSVIQADGNRIDDSTGTLAEAVSSGSSETQVEESPQTEGGHSSENPWNTKAFLESLATNPRAARMKDLPAKGKGGDGSLDEIPLRVFVYDLPDVWKGCELHLPDFMNSIYGSEAVIPELLRDSQYVTSDPDKADLFLVHANVYCAQNSEELEETGNQGVGYPEIMTYLVKYLQTHRPYWDKRGGIDHIFVLSQDNGFCGFIPHRGTAGVIANSIKLVHWGLTKDDRPCSQASRINNYDHCDRREMELNDDHWLPCFLPLRDTVVPYTDSNDFNSVVNDSLLFPSRAAVRAIPSENLQFTFETLYEEGSTRAAVEQGLIDAETGIPRKNSTFYFHGGVMEDNAEYSHGTRQTIYKMFHETPDFTVIDRLAEEKSPLEVALDTINATFCLAVAGSGWGVRLKRSLASGCIPVVASDDVQMEFEDVLPYQDFAIRIPYHYFYQLESILGDLLKQPDQIQAMQERVNCVARYLSYNPDHGRVLDTLMCSLKRKVYGWDNVFPLMDWETCTLHCGFLNSLPDSADWDRTERWSLADHVQRRKLTPWRRG